MNAVRVAAALLALVLPVTALAAEPDGDLDLIPDTLMVPDASGVAAPAADGPTKASLEVAPRAVFWRHGVAVPPPDGTEPRWTGRLSLDVRTEQRLSDAWKAVFADRFDQGLAEGRDPRIADGRNTLKEAYVTWAPPGAPAYVDLGRVNVRNGVALGFNPTDVFRAGAVRSFISADPAVLRENRLGALMARGQAVWTGGSITAIYAPRVADGDRVPSDEPLALGFERTNRQDRILLKGAAELAEDLAPELLVTRAGGEPVRLGLNLTRGVGDALVLYGEWSGGRGRSVAAEALRAARRTGVVPPAGPTRPLVGEGEYFVHQAALGASLTTPSKLTLNVEYHLNGAGLTRGQMRRFVDLAAANAGAGRLWWLTRRYASESLEPLTRHSLFLRANWTDVPVRDAEVTGLLRLSQDGSAFAQVEALYHVSAGWTAGITVGGTLGSTRSEYGGLAEAAAAQARLIRYF